MPEYIAHFHSLSVKADAVGVSLLQDGDIVDLSFEQIDGVVQALQSAKAKHQLKQGKEMLSSLRASLDDEKPAAKARPTLVPTDGPEAA